MELEHIFSFAILNCNHALYYLVYFSSNIVPSGLGDANKIVFSLFLYLVSKITKKALSTNIVTRLCLRMTYLHRGNNMGKNRHFFLCLDQDN